MIPAPAAAGKVKLSLHGAWRGRAGPGLAGNDDSGWGGSARGGGKGCLRGEVRCLAGRGAGGCGTGAGGGEPGGRLAFVPVPCRALGWWRVRIATRWEEAFQRGRARF